MELVDPFLPWTTDPSSWNQKPPTLGLPTEFSFTLVPNSPAAEQPGFPFPPDRAPEENAPQHPACPPIATCLLPGQPQS